MTVAPARRDAAPAPQRETPLAPLPARKKRRDPLWARLTLIFGAVLMMAGGAGIAGTTWVISSATKAVTQDNLLGTTKKTAQEGGGDTLEGPIDLLLMGVDARKRWAVDDLRSDTIIVLHIPASHDQAYLVSIPRDTKMKIPAFAKSKYPGGSAKATEAFFFGAQN
ncbi:MAG: LCP family protein, partial [Catenulispora sp.]